MEYINSGTVLKGRFIASNIEKFKQSFSKFEGKECEVIVRSKKKKRSNKQNRYMWGVVYKLYAEYLGYTSDDIHNLLRIKFLPVFIGDEKLPGSTSKLNKKEMEEYLTKCRNYGNSEFSLNIPLPNEVEFY